VERQRKGDTQLKMQLEEKWNMEHVKSLLLILPPDHPDRRTLMNVLSNASNGIMKVKYKFGKDMDFGRRFSSNAYQNVSTEIQNICADGNYTDIDAVNAFPSLLRQILAKHNIACPLLDAYVDGREGIIAAIQTDYPQLSRDDLKIAFIVALHNGNYMEHEMRDVARMQ
jgi:hypothetical protein